MFHKLVETLQTASGCYINRPTRSVFDETMNSANDDPGARGFIRHLWLRFPGESRDEERKQRRGLSESAQGAFPLQPLATPGQEAQVTQDFSTMKSL